jgi:hypothetical protein
MEIIGYILGVVLHVGFKWASWKQGSKSAWSAYWNEYSGVNIAGGIAAVVCFGLWESGAIPAVLGAVANAAASVVGHQGTVPLPGGFWGSLAAGYLMDSVARTLWMAIERRAAAKSAP